MTTDPPVTANAEGAGHDAAHTAARREVRSEELFGDSRVVLIRHADAIYTLRRTSSGKLILTK